MNVSIKPKTFIEYASVPVRVKISFCVWPSYIHKDQVNATCIAFLL